MKVLDYFLFLGAIALLGLSYFLITEGNLKLATVVNLCAFVCGGIGGSRIGGRIHKKNQENNK